MNNKQIADRLERKSIKKLKAKKLADGVPYVPPLPHLVVKAPHCVTQVSACVCIMHRVVKGHSWTLDYMFELRLSFSSTAVHILLRGYVLAHVHLDHGISVCNVTSGYSKLTVCSLCNEIQVRAATTAVQLLAVPVEVFLKIVEENDMTDQFKQIAKRRNEMFLEALENADVIFGCVLREHSFTI